MLICEKESERLYTNYKISRVVDGDGFYVYEIFNKKEIEIRLLGIDAPEIKDCKKLRQDERELHIPGELLIELGNQSKVFLHNLLPKETPITIKTVLGNEIDIYGRTLAYAYNQEGECINEIMIREGYAKPYDKYYCSNLFRYQQLNHQARLQNKGLYMGLHIF